MNATHPITLKRLLLAATILSGPLLAAAITPAAAQVSISLSVPVAPPELPVYDQPPMPDVGYVWTPGYWAWEQADGYYWVPGTWVQPPQANVLWTPPYWGWSNNAWLFYAGYWGQQVGYYGGVNYGYGYGGRGYQGGRWEGGHFDYNRTVNNFGSVHVPNVYESRVTVLNNSHVSYQGGTGGLRTAPNTAERQAAAEHHVPMTALQTSHIAAAAKLPNAAAKSNGGHPAVVATSRPNQFEGTGVIRADHANAPAAAEAKPGQAGQHAAVPPPNHGVTPQADHATAPAAPGQIARPDEHGATLPANHATAIPEVVRPEQHGAPPAEHATAPAAPHEIARPDEHGATPPANHATAAPEAVHPEQRGAPPAEHAAAPPAAHEAPRPAEHAAAPPPEHTAPPAAHEAPRPAEHAAAPPPAPAQHAAAQPAAQHAGPAEAHPEPGEKKEK